MAVPDYPFIRLWSKELGSMDYYIRDQVEHAREAGAPQNAIYERVGPGGLKTGEWATTDDLAADHPFRVRYVEEAASE